MKHLQFLDSRMGFESALIGSYSPALVIVSFLIAYTSIWIGFTMAARQPLVDSTFSRLLWLSGGAFVTGLGIWSMHFIGMLSYELPLPFVFNMPFVILSIVPALLMSLISLWTFSRPFTSPAVMILCGLLMGLGIFAMHVVGMIGMHVNADIYYDKSSFMMAAGLTFAFAVLAFMLKSYTGKYALSPQGQMLLATASMGTAVTCMHYTVMHTAYFFPSDGKGAAVQGLSAELLSVLIVGGVLIIFLFGILLLLFSRHRHLLARPLDEGGKTAAILNGIPDAIVVTNRRARIINANPSAERMFGQPISLLIGQHIKSIMPVRVGSEGQDYVKRNGNKVDQGAHEYIGLRNDGKQFPVEVVLNTIIDDGEEVYIGICRDITKRKAAQQEIESNRKQLQKLLSERTEQMNIARDANEMKSSFLANMSHELRTPLNAILGITEMLHEEAEEDGDDHLLEPLERVNGAGKHLLKLINDILDLSKIEAGKIELHVELSDVVDFVNDITVTVMSLGAANNNEITTYVSPDVADMRVDLTRLKQVMINLIGNACKFTKNGKVSLTVSGSVGKDGSERLVFSVTDTGIGMTEEQIAALFQDFHQADSSTTKEFGGTGLGLAISKRLVSLMGGDIIVESSPGCGATFKVDIPRHMEIEEGEYAENAATSLSRQLGAKGQKTAPGRKVLIIDDDRTAQNLLSEILKKEGYIPISAATGLDGLTLACQDMFSAILLDIKLPDINGWDILAALKADKRSRHTPVVLCTMVDKEERSHVLGAVEHLTKPIPKAKLYAVLADHIGTANDMNILVVEDNAATRGAMRRQIEQKGCRVREAINGVQALKRLEEEIPDLIFLDLMMPKMDGFEVLDHLRSREKWSGIPVVVATALDITAEQRVRLEKATQYIYERGDSDKETYFNGITHLLEKVMLP